MQSAEKGISRAKKYTAMWYVFKFEILLAVFLCTKLSVNSALWIWKFSNSRILEIENAGNRNQVW